MRLHGGGLQLGYVDSASYVRCLNGRGPWPPTVFPAAPGPGVAGGAGGAGGAEELDGEARQVALGMTDKAALLAEIRQGTT